jgi:hypothetical protein
MIEIGADESSKKLDEIGERILGVMNSVKRNKVIIIEGGHAALTVSNANEIRRVEMLPFSRWRVIGLGMYWRAASTANDDPIVEFGRVGDPDAYGKMTSAITGGEKFVAGDHQKYDPLELLCPNVIAETSATLVVTWTQGVEFGVWNTVVRDLQVAEAAVLGMTSGQVRTYMLIEVDTGGKW